MESNTGEQEDNERVTNEKRTIILSKLNDLENYIRIGDINTIRIIINFLQEHFWSNKVLFEELYKSGKCITLTDLIFSACLYKQADILHLLLNETDFLDFMNDESCDVRKEDKKRSAAFRNAICSDNFNMVEMLYDYWSRNMHWSGYDDVKFINNIQRLGRLLENARVKCQNYLIQKQQMLVNVHCLIVFNTFQRELFNELQKLKSKSIFANDAKNKAKAVGVMLLNLLRIYDKYSYLDIVRIPKGLQEDEQIIKARFEDKTSVYYKGLAYIMYEIYFRKLDFNISLLILENLNVLRLHLKKCFNNCNKHSGPQRAENDSVAGPVRGGEIDTRQQQTGKSGERRGKHLLCSGTQQPYRNNCNKEQEAAVEQYGEIESTLYHFIYRVTEDWRLYIPGKRQQFIRKNQVGFHEGQIYYNLEIKYDKHKIYNGPVIYLERRQFKKCLKKLKKILKKYIVRKGLVTEMHNPKDTNNSLDQKVLLDNNYLKQIKYLRDQYSLKKIVYYLEALESTSKCDDATENSYLIIERALQVIGEMLKATKDSYHLSPTTKALLETELSIETIQHLHSIREYLSHVDKGQVSRRIEVVEREQSTFRSVQQDMKKITQSLYPILDMYNSILDKSLLQRGICLLNKRLENLPDEARLHINYIYEHYRGYDSDFENNYLQQVWMPTGLSTQLLKEILWILDNRDELTNKKEQENTRITDWALIILPKYIKIIKRTLEVILENNKNWKLIKDKLIEYKIQKLPEYPFKIENREIDLKLISDKLKKMMKKINKFDQDLLKRLDQIQNLTIHWESIKNILEFFWNEIDCFTWSETEKIREIIDKDSLPDFQTINTLNQILKQMQNWCLNESTHYNFLADESYTEHAFNGIEKLNKIIYIESNKQESSRNKREHLLLCLINRIDQLKKTLEYSKKISLRQHLLRYRRDQKFQFMVEMLLADISNILVECKIRLMDKSAKLLTGIDLGNVLDHGNPFLEVIGEVLDSHDFPTELLSKAMMFAEDADSISALYRLFKDKIDSESIKLNDRRMMSHEQRKSLDQFRMSDRWEIYLKLIPRQGAEAQCARKKP